MKMKDNRTNYMRSKCGTFNTEVDLNDNAAGRSRYEWFHFVRSNYARENLSLRRRSRELCKNLRRLTREDILKNIPKSSQIHDYTRRAHVLRDVM